MAKAPSSKSIRTRKDGRKGLFVYLDADLIKSLKRAALDEDCNTYDIVERATRRWLEDHNAGGAAKRAGKQ